MASWGLEETWVGRVAVIQSNKECQQLREPSLTECYFLHLRQVWSLRERFGLKVEGAYYTQQVHTVMPLLVFLRVPPLFVWESTRLLSTENSNISIVFAHRQLVNSNTWGPWALPTAILRQRRHVLVRQKKNEWVNWGCGYFGGHLSGPYMSNWKDTFDIICMWNPGMNYQYGIIWRLVNVLWEVDHVMFPLPGTDDLSSRNRHRFQMWVDGFAFITLRKSLLFEGWHRIP